MPYNLRHRSIRQDLLDKIGEATPEDDVSHDSGENENNDSDEQSYESESSGGSQSDAEMEDASSSNRDLESRAPGRPSTTLKGKNGHKWKTTASERQSARMSDVPPVYVPGPTGDAANLDTIELFWDFLFNAEIINIIVESTNTKIEEICLPLTLDDEAQSYHHLTDADEIRAYIGVLYYQGLWKSSNVDNDRLWEKKNGITMYRCVFSRQRFTFLASCLRFDEKRSRNPHDRFAPIRDVWDIFIGNCQRYYTPSNKCTVDEQLLSFRGRCLFRMYMKDKPDKYGLKIVTLNDAETAYLIHGVPYLGKGSVVVGNEKIQEYFFRVVTTPIHGTHRTVTCDNWFMSVPLVKRMFPAPYNTKMTGTIRKNKREIPAQMKIASKEPPAAQFCHDDNLTLVSFTPKKNKIVLLLSSYINSTELTNSKPDIIHHYNETKGGTDTFDQLCHSYSVTRRTNRWPVRIFYGILDQAVVNARILLKCKLNAANSKEKVSAITCLEKLSLHLIRPYLTKRYELPTLRRDLKIGIAGILGLDIHEAKRYERVKLLKRMRCAECSRKNDRKTNEACSHCKRPICEEHRLMFCATCVKYE